MHDRLRGVLERDVLDEPVVVLEALLAASNGSERRSNILGMRICDSGSRQTSRARRALLGEHDLVLLHAQRHQIAIVAPVDEALARALLLAGQERQKVEAVEMHLEGRAADVMCPSSLSRRGPARRPRPRRSG